VPASLNQAQEITLKRISAFGHFDKMHEYTCDLLISEAQRSRLNRVLNNQVKGTFERLKISLAMENSPSMLIIDGYSLFKY